MFFLVKKSEKKSEKIREKNCEKNGEKRSEKFYDPLINDKILEKIFDTSMDKSSRKMRTSKTFEFPPDELEEIPLKIPMSPSRNFRIKNSYFSKPFNSLINAQMIESSMKNLEKPPSIKPLKIQKKSSHNSPLNALSPLKKSKFGDFEVNFDTAKMIIRSKRQIFLVTHIFLLSLLYLLPLIKHHYGDTNYPLMMRPTLSWL